MSIAKLSALSLLVIAGCGAANEPAKTAAPAASSSAPEAPSAPVEAPAKVEDPAPSPSAAPPAAEAPAAGSGGTGLTVAALDEANKIVADAYPGPFAKTYPKVVAKLGEPKKKGDNMYQWYALDGTKCIMFFVTKDSTKGHAASGRAETQASDCK